jgi:hypothetical protein
MKKIITGIVLAAFLLPVVPDAQAGREVKIQQMMKECEQECETIINATSATQNDEDDIKEKKFDSCLMGCNLYYNLLKNHCSLHYLSVNERICE